MKQLRLFDFFGFDLLKKLVKESETGKKNKSHWNGEPWVS